MSVEDTLTPTEKRFAAFGLTQTAIMDQLLDLLVTKGIISAGDVKELYQEAALIFMKPNATEVEKLAAESLLPYVTSSAEGKRG
jgi:hypothetical protein